MLAFADMAIAAIIGAALAAIPGTIAAVASIKAIKQTRPNGGSSMRDSLNQLHTKFDSHVEATAERFDKTDERLDQIEGYLTSPPAVRELGGGRDFSRFPHLVRHPSDFPA